MNKLDPYRFSVRPYILEAPDSASSSIISVPPCWILLAAPHSAHLAEFLILHRSDSDSPATTYAFVRTRQDHLSRYRRMLQVVIKKQWNGVQTKCGDGQVGMAWRRQRWWEIWHSSQTEVSVIRCAYIMDCSHCERLSSEGRRHLTCSTCLRIVFMAHLRMPPSPA